MTALTNSHILGEAGSLLHFLDIQMRPVLARLASLEERVAVLERERRSTAERFLAILHPDRPE